MAEPSEAATGGTGESRSMREALKRYVVGQFMKPHGFMGRAAGWIMAARDSNRRRNRWTVELMNPAPSDRILEIGYGPGFALDLVCARLAGGKAAGIDHSQTMYDMAHARNRAAIESGKLHLAVGSVEQLAGTSDPWLTGPFDHIYAVNVAMFCKDQTRVFEILRSLLSPGGKIYMTLQPRLGPQTDHAALRSAEAIRSHLLAAGLADIRLETLETLRPMAVCVIGSAAARTRK